MAGGSTFIAGRFDAATFWETVERARPTFFSAVPTIYSLLVSQPGGQADTRPSASSSAVRPRCRAS